MIFRTVLVPFLIKIIRKIKFLHLKIGIYFHRNMKIFNSINAYLEKDIK
jgi:hypothetical protein